MKWKLSENEHPNLRTTCLCKTVDNHYMICVYKLYEDQDKNFPWWCTISDNEYSDTIIKEWIPINEINNMCK